MLLPTNSSKEKNDQCLACYLRCLPSVYDIVTCSQQKIKDLGGGEGGESAWYVTTCPCGVFSGDGSNMRDKYLSPAD